jgi:hypothetical protein
MALPSALPTVERASTMLGRVAANPALRYAARDAAFYGGLQGGATAAQTYGENGNVGDAINSGVTDAILGGALQGGLDLAGHYVGKGARKGYESLIPVANKTLDSLRRPPEVRIGDEVVDLASQGEHAFDKPSEQQIATPTDSNVSFQSKLDNSPLGGNSQILGDGIVPLTDRYVPPSSPNSAASLVPVRQDMPAVDGVANPVPVESKQMPVDSVRLDKVVPASNVQAVAPSTTDGMVKTTEALPAATTNTPMLRSDEIRQLQEAKAGATQAQDAAINQRMQEIDNTAPVDNSVPDGMNSGAQVPTEPASRQALADRMISRLDQPTELKQQIANAAGARYDSELPVSDILAQSHGTQGLKDEITRQYGELNNKIAQYNEFQNANRDAFSTAGTAGLNPEVSRQRSKITSDIGRMERDLVSNIRRLEGQKSMTARVANAVENFTGMRSANMLSSVGGLERNLAQELGANLVMSIQHPFQMLRSTFGNGNLAGDALKNSLKEWTVKPKVLSEVPRYVVGNAYRTAMSLTTAGANARKGIMRENIARLALEMNGEPASAADVKAFANAMGNEAESVVNVLAGVANGMSHQKEALDALNQYKEFMRTGSDADKRLFMQKVSQQTNVARELADFITRNDKKSAGVSGQQATLADQLSWFEPDNSNTRARIVASLVNLAMPFVSTPRNLLITAVHQTFNPLARSLPDEIIRDVRSNPYNVGAILRQKAADVGIIGGAMALVNSGVIGYNNGDEVDKPQGVYISIGNNQYVPIRAVALEIPVAAAVTAAVITKDVAEGHVRNGGYYAGIIGNSLPYADTINQTTGAVDSLVNGQQEGGDSNYAAKSYGVNMAKSFVPFSNNGVLPAIESAQGKSLNAKSTYDKDIGKWLGNSVSKGYMTEDQYNKLKDSRDNAGRVRTLDNQGLIINKTINDASTAKYNDTIDSLVKYGRDSGLGKGTQDMFNTYDTGKNNNFKSVQDSITFLDTNGGSPDSAKKLEANGKLTDLSRQIRDGFYGDTGSELLTLDGKELKSDASVPNKTGSKNSRLPLSMQSIKNAVAQTDISSADSAKLYQYSQAKTDLYNQLKAKAIDYDQYSAAKSDLERGEISILSGSKNYQKLVGLMNELDGSGFFADGGLGSTKSGQTYLWNSLNTLLGSKGATPAANYPDSNSSYTPFGRGGRRGTGLGSTNKPGNTGTDGIKWTPAKARQMATVQSGKYTPLTIKVKLGNEVKKNKTQNYSDRSF